MLRSRFAEAVVAGREAMPLVRAIGDPDTQAGCSTRSASR